MQTQRETKAWYHHCVEVGHSDHGESAIKVWGFKKSAEVKHQLQFTVIAKHCFSKTLCEKPQSNERPYMLSVIQMN